MTDPKLEQTVIHNGRRATVKDVASKEALLEYGNEQREWVEAEFPFSQAYGTNEPIEKGDRVIQHEENPYFDTRTGTVKRIHENMASVDFDRTPEHTSTLTDLDSLRKMDDKHMSVHQPAKQ